MKTDVLVVGAGVVGLTAAAALARSGLDVLVVERAPAPAALGPDDVDLRVSTFTRASEQVLRRVGAWARLPPERIFRFQEMRVWEGSAEVHYDSADVGLGSLGCVLENAAVRSALVGAVEANSNARIAHGQSVRSLLLDGCAARVVTDAGTIEAALVVGADGVESPMRSLAGIGVDRVDYHQRAIVATVQTSLSHRNTAWQRFLPSGPLAFLPMGARGSSIVWSTGEAAADELESCEREAFEAALAEASAFRLGAVRLTSERVSFPLGSLHARRYVCSRLALVGDAAHAVHPLAGQGVNLGILDAAALAEVVSRAHQRGRDFGREANLRRFERWRRGHNALMRASLSGFKYLFESPLPPIGGLRRLGLSATERMAPVKQALMRFASGVEGDLPSLARPEYAVDGLPAED